MTFHNGFPSSQNQNSPAAEKEGGALQSGREEERPFADNLTDGSSDQKTYEESVIDEDGLSL